MVSLNQVATQFDSTVGVAGNIANGGIILRAGAQLADAGIDYARRGADVLIGSTKKLTGNSDDLVKNSEETLAGKGKGVDSSVGGGTKTAEDIRMGADGEMVVQPFQLPQVVENISGSNVTRVSSEIANGTYPKPAYHPDYPIYDFNADGNATYVRVFAEGVNNPSGAWMMRLEDIQGLSPSQIQEQFDLPALPTSIVDVAPPTGTVVV